MCLETHYLQYEYGVVNFANVKVHLLLYPVFWLLAFSINVLALSCKTLDALGKWCYWEKYHRKDMTADE